MREPGIDSPARPPIDRTCVRPCCSNTSKSAFGGLERPGFLRQYKSNRALCGNAAEEGRARIGIPTEIKPKEGRVVLIPPAAAELVRNGHEVLVRPVPAFRAATVGARELRFRILPDQVSRWTTPSINSHPPSRYCSVLPQLSGLPSSGLPRALWFCIHRCVTAR